MYTIEKAQTCSPGFPDFTRAKKNIAGQTNRIMTAVMGHEFMALTPRNKVFALYFLLSFMLLFAWNENYLWPNLLNMANFVIAARLANKAVRSTSARD